MMIFSIQNSSVLGGTNLNIACITEIDYEHPPIFYPVSRVLAIAA